MPSTDTARAGNRYCERLGLASPDLDAASRSSQVTLKDLMVLALLEAGEAQSLEAIASRLARLDLPPRLARADDPASLLKAWHGQPPLVRDPFDGHLYLDLLSHHEVRLAAFIGDRPSSSAQPESGGFRQAPDDVPLSVEEVEAAFKGRPLGAYSSVRRAAAILEGSGGGPKPLDEVNRRLVALAGRSSAIDERAARRWPSDLVRLTSDGLLHFDPQSSGTRAFRRDIRKMALAALRERARRETSRTARAERHAELAAEEQRDLEEARTRHTEFDETRRWAGDFEPDRFDVRAADAAMAAVSWY